MFGLTCLWIVYKRILRGPLGLMFWASTKALGLTSGFAKRGQANVAVVDDVEVKTKELTETGFQEAMTTEPLWSEGFEDDTIETVTVTVEIDEETPEVANV